VASLQYLMLLRAVVTLAVRQQLLLPSMQSRGRLLQGMGREKMHLLLPQQQGMVISLMPWHLLVLRHQMAPMTR
jgi:hypothetical protein